MSNCNEKPLVSIITVVFNGVNTIERTIKSVLSQSYTNIEYIIIDGGSNDGTTDVIATYKKHLSKYISEKDDGITYAMNKGICHATGDIIGLINADDWLEEDAIKEVVKFYIENPVAVLYGDMRVHINSKNYYIEKVPSVLNLKKGMVLNHPSVFVPASLYEKHGTFNVKYKIVFDWELVLRFKLSGVKFVKIDEILSNFSVGGVSTLRAKQLIEEMHQIRKENSLYKIIDKYYVINRFRSIFFGSHIIKISQKIRLLKYRLNHKR